jgi:hypothetical protein
VFIIGGITGVEKSELEMFGLKAGEEKINCIKPTAYVPSLWVYVTTLCRRQRIDLMMETIKTSET